MPATKEEVVRLIKLKGPVLPAEITAELETNTIILSAILSELIKDGLVLFSHKKIGSSPLYYLLGQEDVMRKKLLPNLSIIEKKTLEFFENNKLMLRSNLSPQQRLVVNQINDFVKPIELKIKGEEKTFYRHYSLDISVIEQELKNMASPKKLVKKKKQEEEPPKNQKKLFVNLEKENVPEHLSINSSVQKLFDKLGLKPISKEVIKKGSEVNYVAVTRNIIGQKYFVKIKKRGRINEKDLSMIYLEAINKKMPCLMITRAKLTKKAEQLLEKNIGDYIKIIKL